MIARGAAMMTLALGLMTALPLSSATAQAPQAPTTDIIDRIVAVVGDRAILLSEVDEAINMSRNPNEPMPEDSATIYRMRRQYLENMIDEEVLYQKARRDTAIAVTDAEVQTAVDAQYRQIRQQFRTEVEFRAALRTLFGSPEEYRRWLTEQSRRQAYTQRFVQKQKADGKLRSGTVTDAEMRRFFDEAREAGQLPQVPPTITFRQIVVSPRPSDSSRIRAFQRAESLTVAIAQGADFSELARRFSDDAGSKEAGGDLGFFRRGMMVRAFEEAAFSMRPGQVSPPIRTEFGYHIIMVDRVQPAEVKARHILLAPVITDVEARIARSRADTVAALIRSGANVDSLARLYGDSSEPRVIAPTNRDSLPNGYRQALATADSGQVVGPAPLTPEAPERTRWMVAVVIDAKAAHAATFEDVRDRIRSQMIEQRGMRNLIDDLKRQTFVDIRL